MKVAFQQMVSTDAKYSNGKITIGGVAVDQWNGEFQRTVYGNKVPQYVILLSDGEPDAKTDTGTDTVANIKKEAKAWADAFDTLGIPIYTVAFSTNSNNKSWLKQNIATSSSYAKEANNASELQSVFEAIITEATSKVDYVYVDVVDYIDPRFVVLDDAGNQITESGVQITTTASDGIEKKGTVKFDSAGRQYVIWDDQKATKEGSSWTVKVQAKTDYIGGNNVKTNIDGLSKIRTDYGDFDLPDPVVNVKAWLNLKDYALTVYRGSSIPISGDNGKNISDNLFDVKWLEIQETLKYEGVEASDFTLTWYTDSSLTNVITVEEMKMIEPSDTAYYYLKVTYNPGTPTDESNANTTKDKTVHIAGNDDGLNNGIVEATIENSTRNYGIYKINVWEMLKYSSSSGQKLEVAGAEFKVQGTTGTTYYGKSNDTGRVVMYADNSFDTLATITKAGKYTITETKSPTGYLLSSEVWTLDITDQNGVEKATSSFGRTIEKQRNISYIYYNDVEVFELPSTGGFGIYWYLFSGMMLMMGGSLILHNKHCKEVLGE